MERRQMTRYDFGAIAEVVDLDSREDMIVVTRDLSFSGCFVKTRTPFRAGTEVRLRIAYGGSDFAASGMVTGHITREGMGIEFTEMGPRDRAIIEEWLTVVALKDMDRPGASTEAGSRVVKLKNRLNRQQKLPRLPSVEPKAEKPSLANEFLATARNLWKFRNEARH